MGSTKRTVTIVFSVIALLSAVSATGQQTTAVQDKNPKYRNPNLTIDERVSDLLSRMTIEEKVEQISGGGRRRSGLSLIDPTGTFKPEDAQTVMQSLYNPDSQMTPKQGAILRNAVQRYLREKTPLGIPSLFMGEALHGFMGNGATSFPQA